VQPQQPPPPQQQHLQQVQVNNSSSAQSGSTASSRAASNAAVARRPVRKMASFSLMATDGPFQDIKLGPLLGKGAFGRVYRGTWLGCNTHTRCSAVVCNRPAAVHSSRNVRHVGLCCTCLLALGSPMPGTCSPVLHSICAHAALVVGAVLMYMRCCCWCGACRHVERQDGGSQSAGVCAAAE
jgi:hypothetical protein